MVEFQVTVTVALLTLYCWNQVQTEFICEPVPADILFINDASQSVGSANFQKTLRFIENVVKGLVIGPHDAQIGLMTFSDNAELQFHLNTFSQRQEIVNRIAATEYTESWTYTNRALDYARDFCFKRDAGMRTYAIQIAIVITDGQSTKPDETTVAAQMLRDVGVTIFAIGVGDGPNQAELSRIASDPDDKHVFSVDDFNSLNKIKESLQKRACEAKPANMCPGRADIVFVLENSIYVGQKNLNTTLQLVRNITSGFFIGPNEVQIGVDTFSSTATHEFSLVENNSHFSLKHALASIRSKSGGTNTGEALKKLREESFSAASGGRDGVPKIAVVMTTRESTNGKLTYEEAKRARDAGIILLAVGVGDQRSEPELKAIASGSKHDNLFIAQQYGSLRSEHKTIFSNLCGKIESETQEQTTCGTKADIAILVESTGAGDFESFKDFIELFVQNLEIGQEKVRVAIGSFGSRPWVEVHLNKYNVTEDLAEAISRMQPKSGGRDLAAAISYMDTVMFSAANGDRPGIPNIAIIITASPSTNLEKAKSAAAKARANKITIFTLGVGDDLLRNELNALASEPSSMHVLTVTDFHKLNSLKSAFQGQTCQAMPANLPTEVIDEISKSVEPCEDSEPDCPNYGPKICTGDNKQWGMENCKRFCGYCSALSQILSSSNNKCNYKNTEYDQGEKWDDGCSYSCECEDASLGAYTCYSKCPAYSNLHRECKLAKKPGECCLQPQCHFKKTFLTKDVHKHCVYSGQKYSEGEIWSVDCEFICRCRNATTGFYSCQSRCPKYESLPSNCKLVRSPGDCCEKPQCQFDTIVSKFKARSLLLRSAEEKVEETHCVDKLVDCDKYPQKFCSPSINISFALDHCRKSCGYCPPGADSSLQASPSDVCVYNGQTFQQGESLQDGCQKTCFCEDARSGNVRCEENCPDYLNLPRHCSLVEVPNECCKQLNCGNETIVNSTVPDREAVGDSDSSLVSQELLLPVCGPVEEGQPTTMTCKGLLEDCDNLFQIKWSGGDRDLFYCGSDSCGHVNRHDATFEARVGRAVSKITTIPTVSELTISNVSRELPFDMETNWACVVCGNTEGLACDRLQIYAKPESPTCTVTENMEVGEIASFTLTCSTTKVYPRAKCSFYTMNNSNSSAKSVMRTPVYSHLETGGTPVYYSSSCSVTVPVHDLGEGTHTFQGYIYPDVTGGQSLVTGIRSIKTTKLDFPQVSYTCMPGLVGGYFRENSAICTCNMTSAGIPGGKAQWYQGDRPVGVDGVLKLTYVEKRGAQVFTCEATSKLGRKVGSTLTAKFPEHKKEDRQAQKKAKLMVSGAIISAFFMVAFFAAKRARN